MGASLSVMEEGAARMRMERPFVFTNMKDEIGVEEIVAFIVAQGMVDL